MERVPYTELSRALLNTLEKNTTVRWFGSGLSPSRHFPNLKGERLFVFVWDTGELTWAWLKYFEKITEKYEKVKPGEFIRRCVDKFPKT